MFFMKKNIFTNIARIAGIALCGTTVLHAQTLRESIAGTPPPAIASTNSTNAEDQYHLGKAYERGEGVGQSYEQAGFWYLKAAQQGNTKAMHNLGILYLNGKGTPKDEAEAYRWISKAAELGSPKSCAVCGMMLNRGMGTPRDTAAAHAMLEKGVLAGDPQAERLLGTMLLTDDPAGSRDPKRAAVLLLSSAEQNNPEACSQLSTLLRGGDTGLPSDAREADRWLKRGAELGRPECLFEYGRSFMSTNPRMAYPWIKLAADQHYPQAMGMFSELQGYVPTEERAKGDHEADTIASNFPGATNPATSNQAPHEKGK